MLKGIRQEAIVKPGGIIELASPDLPVGISVEVIVLVNEDSRQPEDTADSEDKWAEFYKSAVGAWKDDEEINQIFKEIELNRRHSTSRETPTFDDYIG
ncbi:MAG: hypothetical protein WBB01_00320 [Phormidesmis sp.]